MAKVTLPTIPTIPGTDDENPPWIPKVDGTEVKQLVPALPTFGVEASFADISTPNLPTSFTEPLANFGQKLKKTYGLNSDVPLIDRSGLVYNKEQLEAVAQTAAADLTEIKSVGGIDIPNPADAVTSLADNYSKVNPGVPPSTGPTENVLHGYSTFTYRITLGVQDRTAYNKMVDVMQGSETVPATEWSTPVFSEVLITSGGAEKIDSGNPTGGSAAGLSTDATLSTSRSGKGGVISRNKFFKEDFFIENLRLITVIAPDPRAGTGNVVGVTFEIVEPYGVSLIERLLAVAEQLGYKNYVELPYLLRIDFIGYDSDNNPIPGTIGNTTKYIPIRITNMKFKVNEKGTVYQCNCVPYGHMAHNQMVATIPVSVTVAASTVNNFFNTKGAVVSDSEVRTKDQVARDRGNASAGKSAGLVQIVNDWHSSLTRTRRKNSRADRFVADKIAVVFHDPKIADAVIDIENIAKYSQQKTYTNLDGRDAHKGGNGRQAMRTIEYDHHFNIRSSISKIIEKTIMGSSYYLTQVKAYETEVARAGQAARSGQGDHRINESLKPYKNFKITTTYKLGEFDPYANRHAYIATFNVDSYTTQGQAEQTVAQAAPTNILKEYDYIFTGKNRDIIDLDLDFNLVFLAKRSVTNATGSGTNQARQLRATDTTREENTYNDAVNQGTTEHIDGNQEPNVGAATYGVSVAAQQIADQHQSLLEGTQGDMTRVTMTILGDPDWIKQDDIVYRSSSSKGETVTPTGSIIQDSGELYIRLRFKTLDDINHNTGLRWEAKDLENSFSGRSSVFDGIYKIISIDNSFNGGQFTQTMNMVRLFKQDKKNEFTGAGVTNNRETADLDQVINNKASSVADTSVPTRPSVIATPLPNREEIIATPIPPTGNAATAGPDGFTGTITTAQFDEDGFQTGSTTVPF